MGLFSRLRRNIRRIGRDVGEIAEAVAPIAVPLLLGGVGAAILPQLLPGILGTPPSSAGGAGAVAQQALTGPRCPVGFVGGRSNSSPIARAAFSPGFDVNRLPARSRFAGQQFGQFGTIPPPFAFPQTTGFSQQSFGAPLAPSFRPFQPSFRSGRFGFSGQAPAGFSQGFDPQRLTSQQFQQFAPRLQQQVPRQFTGFGFGGF